MPPICVKLKRKFVKYNTLKQKAQKANGRSQKAKGFPPFAILAVRSTEILFIYAFRCSDTFRYICICSAANRRPLLMQQATTTMNRRSSSSSSNSKWKIYSHIAHISMPLSDKVAQLDSDTFAVTDIRLQLHGYGYIEQINMHSLDLPASRCQFVFFVFPPALLLGYFIFCYHANENGDSSSSSCRVFAQGISDWISFVF